MIGRLEAWLRALATRLSRDMLILQLLGLAFFIAGTHGAFVKLSGPPTTTDFASFYAAGTLANQGRAAAAYDPATHLLAVRAAVAPGVDAEPFLNAPVFLLVCAPLARLPYLVAFVIFELATFLPWLWVTSRIAAGAEATAHTLFRGLGGAAICLASVPSVFWALGWGQNSFLSSGLMAGGTLLLARRPALAGALFGALIFKPHFGVVLPIALLAGLRWRAIAGAAASAGLLGVASAALFGPASWLAFLDAARHASRNVENAAQLSGHIDSGGMLRLFGLSDTISWAAQAAVSLVAAGVVGWIWWRGRRVAQPWAGSAANAALVAGTLVCMPFLLFYDLVMGGVAAAWLVRAAREGMPAPGLAAGLAACWVLNFLAFPAAFGGHVALGAVVGPALLWLAVRHRAI
jgi:hypothetical protein